MKHWNSRFTIIALLLVFGSAACGGGSGGGGGGGDPTTVRLRVINNCSDTIWVQQQQMPSTVPQVVKLVTGDHYDYPIPDKGLASTRFWPKTGCDTNGNNCAVGESSPVSGACPAGGCPPAVDSKLEATWGCLLADTTQCADNPSANPVTKLPAETSYNSSAVDGYTLPFKITVTNATLDANCINVDCSNLDMARCPTSDNLSNNGAYPQYASEDLRVINSSNPTVVAGCFSPCTKLNYPGWGGIGLRDPSGAQEALYCCPTPPIDVDTCRAGPVPNTQYVQAIHQMCTGGYGYAYDDNVGNHKCPAAAVYELTFCP